MVAVAVLFSETCNVDERATREKCGNDLVTELTICPAALHVYAVNFYLILLREERKLDGAWTDTVSHETYDGR